jgi:hypothetical protein
MTKSDAMFLLPAALVVALTLLFAVLGQEDEATEAAPYECPSGTELIRGEMTGWFCAVRPKVRP